MVSKPRTLKRFMPMLGLALVASLALSAVGVASASAAVPANTASPVISPATPEQAVVATTSNGTWSGSPTSYAYVWFRCNASGVECKSIAGATKSTYTPVEADVGKTLLTSVTASNAEGSGVALSKPTSLVIAQHWYLCKSVVEGGGGYEDAFCSKAATGKKAVYASERSADGVAKAITVKNTTNFTLIANVGSGVYAEIACSSQASGESTIKNPAAKGSGTASIGKFELGGCVLSKPLSTCKVVEKIPFFPLSGTAIGTTVELKSTSGGPLFNLEFTGVGCPYTSPPAYPYSGTIAANVSNGSSTLEFTKAGSHISFSGGPNLTTLEGTSKMETTTGENLSVAP